MVGIARSIVIFCMHIVSKVGASTTWPLSAIEDAHSGSQEDAYQGFRCEPKDRIASPAEGIDSGASLARSAGGIEIQHKKGAQPAILEGIEIQLGQAEQVRH